MKFRPGPENPRWRGRTVSAKGYVRLWHGPHYGEYEHRAVVAELLKHNTISAGVMPREIPDGFEVHHMDFDRQNNHPSNLLLLHPTFHTHAQFTNGNGKRARLEDLPEEWFEGENRCR